MVFQECITFATQSLTAYIWCTDVCQSCSYYLL